MSFSKTLWTGRPADQLTGRLADQLTGRPANSRAFSRAFSIAGTVPRVDNISTMAQRIFHLDMNASCISLEVLDSPKQGGDTALSAKTRGHPKSWKRLPPGREDQD